MFWTDFIELFSWCLRYTLFLTLQLAKLRKRLLVNRLIVTDWFMIDWLIYSDWLIDWLIDLLWLIYYCLIDWLIDWFIDWLIVWLIDWLTDWLTDWLFDWLIDLLFDWLIERLTDWLIDWAIDWLFIFFKFPTYCFSRRTTFGKWTTYGAKYRPYALTVKRPNTGRVYKFTSFIFHF